MNFGDILSRWEKQNAGNRGYDKDAAQEKDAIYGDNNSAGERRRKLLRKKPDAFIDLHGMSQNEAITALETFFDNSRENGFEKLLLVHGKGSHQGDGVLRELSRRFIETCPFAGESGYSNAKEGGNGATWVILKDQRSR
jgi:DNA-nicking Smr family endonuclease